MATPRAKMPPRRRHAVLSPLAACVIGLLLVLYALGTTKLHVRFWKASSYNNDALDAPFRVASSSVKTQVPSKSHGSAAYSSNALGRNHSQSWWIPYAHQVSRPFSFVPNHKQAVDDGIPYIPHIWCQPHSNNIASLSDRSKPLQGLLYTKGYKASSTTAEGIHIGMARRVGQRLFANNNSTCLHYQGHDLVERYQGPSRRAPTPRSLLWSLVRFPPHRDISMLYFQHVSRQGWNIERDSVKMIRQLNQMKSFQTKYMMAHPEQVKSTISHFQATDSTTTWEATMAHVIQKHILDVYDFIGLTDRLAESLAVLCLLWGLEFTDVIVLSAKQSHLHNIVWDGGTSRNRTTGQRQCVALQGAPKPLPQPLANHLDRANYNHWHADFLLYEIVQQSLDQTIDLRLGRDRVNKMAQQIQAAMDLAVQHCQATAIYPCSSNGTMQWEAAASNCYSHDAGCGYPCVEALVEDIRQGKIRLNV